MISVISIMTMIISFVIMPSSFLTIKQAAEKYDKAEITIRRLVRSVLLSRSIKKRGLIHPTPDEVKILKKQRKPFTYTLSDSLLSESYVDKGAGEGTDSMSNKLGMMPKDYASLLERTNQHLLAQLQVKDEQIHALNGSLDELSERQREANVLMKGLQEQLLLGSGKKIPVLEAKAGSSAQKRGWWRLW